MAACGNEQNANKAKGEAFCCQARALGADVALFPELWNMGYSPAKRTERRKWQAQAIPADGPFVTHYRKLAKKLKMAIALTYLEQWSTGPRSGPRASLRMARASPTLASPIKQVNKGLPSRLFTSTSTLATVALSVPTLGEQMTSTPSIWRALPAASTACLKCSGPASSETSIRSHSEASGGNCGCCCNRYTPRAKAMMFDRIEVCSEQDGLGLTVQGGCG